MYVSKLSSQLTPLVKALYQSLHHGSEQTVKILKQILVMLEKRGIMTMLGFRKTVGS